MSSWSNCGFLISIPNLILRWYVNKYYWDMKDFYKFFFQICEEWLTVFNKCMSCMLSCFSSVRSLSRVWLFVTPWIAAHQASLSITNSRSPLKPMSFDSEMPSSRLILCHLLLLLPPIPPSIRVFSKESTLLMRWPKNWSFSFNISPSNEYSGLISFRMDWLDLLAVQGTLKSLLQHHSSKASILRCSAFSHPYTTTGKTVALTRWTFVGKVMSLLLNMLSRLVSYVQLFVTLWTVSHQAPLSIGFSRQEH